MDAETTLARQITSIDQVAAMETEDLKRLLAAHESECIAIAGRIEACPGARWITGARQALRVLTLHKSWIRRELAERKRIANKNERKQALKAADAIKKSNKLAEAQRQQEARAAREARIKASNDENARQIAVFKDVARDVLGLEMYNHLWELTRVRLETKS